MSSRNITILAVMLVVSYACHVRAERSRYGRYLAQAIVAIDHVALEQVPPQELFDGAMRGMVARLAERGDEHSAFISARDADLFNAELDQQFVGIGVEIRMLGEPPLLTVINPPLLDTPAHRAGIRVGDKIMAVDSKSTAGSSMLELMRQIRGSVGEPVELTILHEGDTKPVSITVLRAIIDTPSVLGDARDENGQWDFRLAADRRIGYLRIVNFGSKTADEFAAALQEVVDQNVEALLLDVRDNLGGALDAAVNACDQFLSEGQQIVSIRGRHASVDETYIASGDGPYRKIPLAILANGNSASSSEILAACLQDHGRAVLIGERTYGKGTVQHIIYTESGRSLLKLTAASYHRPSGKNIHRRSQDTPETEDWGVVPDPGFLVPLSEEQQKQRIEVRRQRDKFGAELASGETVLDPQLQRAVEYLQTKITQQD